MEGFVNFLTTLLFFANIVLMIIAIVKNRQNHSLISGLDTELRNSANQKIQMVKKDRQLFALNLLSVVLIAFGIIFGAIVFIKLAMDFVFTGMVNTIGAIRSMDGGLQSEEIKTVLGQSHGYFASFAIMTGICIAFIKSIIKSSKIKKYVKIKE